MQDTEYKKLIEQQALAFRTSEIYKQFFGECGNCQNTGVYMVQNGPDDFDYEMCSCGLPALEGSIQRYAEIHG